MVATLFILACSRSGSLSGDVYVRVPNGDIRKGADVEVVLVAVTPDFTARWKQIEEEFLPAYSQRLDSCGRKPGLSKYFCPEAGDLQAASKNRAKDLLVQYRIATARTDINGHYNFAPSIRPGLYYLFTSFTFARGRLGPNNEISWSVPVHLTSGKNKVDLTGGNAGWAFDDSAEDRRRLAEKTTR